MIPNNNYERTGIYGFYIWIQLSHLHDKIKKSCIKDKISLAIFKYDKKWNKYMFHKGVYLNLQENQFFMYTYNENFFSVCEITFTKIFYIIFEWVIWNFVYYISVLWWKNNFLLKFHYHAKQKLLPLTRSSICIAKFLHSENSIIFRLYIPWII